MGNGIFNYYEEAKIYADSLEDRDIINIKFVIRI